MLGWVSSAMATASSTESTLPKTCDCGLVTGGDVTGGTTGGAVCVAGGVCADGGAVGACAATFVVATTRSAPASSNLRTPILIALDLPGPERRPSNDLSGPRTTARISRTPSTPTQVGVARRQTARPRTVDERWIRGGRAGDGRWTRFSLTSATCCVVHCPSPQDIGGTPHAVGDPSRQGRHVDRARPARPAGTLPAPQGRRGDRDAGGNVLAGRGLDCRGRGPIQPQPGGGSGGRPGPLRHDWGPLLYPQ